MKEHIVSEIIYLAWDDQTSFDVIQRVYGLTERDVKSIMQKHLKPSSYRLWRKRVYGRKSKHEKRFSDGTKSMKPKR